MMHKNRSVLLALLVGIALTVAFTLSADPAAAGDPGGAQPNGVGWCRSC